MTKITIKEKKDDTILFCPENIPEGSFFLYKESVYQVLRWVNPRKPYARVYCHSLEKDKRAYAISPFYPCPSLKLTILQLDAMELSKVRGA